MTLRNDHEEKELVFGRERHGSVGIAAALTLTALLGTCRGAKERQYQENIVIYPKLAEKRSEYIPSTTSDEIGKEYTHRTMRSE